MEIKDIPAGRLRDKKVISVFEKLQPHRVSTEYINRYFAYLKKTGIDLDRLPGVNKQAKNWLLIEVDTNKEYILYHKKVCYKVGHLKRNFATFAKVGDKVFADGASEMFILWNPKTKSFRGYQQKGGITKYVLLDDLQHS